MTIIQKFVLGGIKVAKKFFYNTPVHRLKIVTVVYDKVFHLAFPAGNTTDVAYEGCVFSVPTDDITILPSLLNDDYEKYELALLRQLLRPGMTFVDAGANIGLFSAIAAKAVGETGQVISFEPEPHNYELLQKNLKTNNIDHVVTEQAALGARGATMELHIDTNSIGTHSLLKAPEKDFASTIHVSVVTLDKYFAKRRQRTIDLMKIDVEGYEPFVLEGGAKTLQHTNVLLFEYIQSQIKRDYGIAKFTKLLRPFPHLYKINEQKQQLEPIKEKDFNTIAYMNVLAAKKPLKNNLKPPATPHQNT